jgi:YD repeat-containing protein
MKRRNVIRALSWAALSSATFDLPTDAAARKRFIGAWTLVSQQHEGKESEKQIGRLTYDKAGRMAVQVMRLGRRSSVSSHLAVASAGIEDLRQIADGFLAYYGSFDIDEANKTVIHHVEACIFPAWVGTDLKRTYEFSGNHLILKVGADRLVWERLPD